MENVLALPDEPRSWLKASGGCPGRSSRSSAGQARPSGSSCRVLPDLGCGGVCIGDKPSRCELNERLVDDLRARRPEAIERLLDEYGRLLQGVAFHVLRSRADAEEVVIDTMVSAWERIGSLREPAALRPWLVRIATRHALSRRRTARPEYQLLATIGHSIPGPDPERIALRDALDRLPSRMRAALSLHYYAGLTVEETAAALGISPNTVKYHLKVGLQRMRDALDVGAERAWQAESPS